jgi:hypothetical protein
VNSTEKKDNFQHNIGTEFSEKNILPTFEKKGATKKIARTTKNIRQPGQPCRFHGKKSSIKPPTK